MRRFLLTTAITIATALMGVTIAELTILALALLEGIIKTISFSWTDLSSHAVFKSFLFLTMLMLSANASFWIGYELGILKASEKKAAAKLTAFAIFYAVALNAIFIALF